MRVKEQNKKGKDTSNLQKGCGALETEILF